MKTNLPIAQESEEIQARCATQDIDFEFLLDASGSIGENNWERTKEIIAKYWIEDSIQPVYNANGRGNHVAARRFSRPTFNPVYSKTDRFIDFQDSAFPFTGNYFSNYTNFVSSLMRNMPYSFFDEHTGPKRDGTTNTAQALSEIRRIDLPTISRMYGIKNVIEAVFKRLDNFVHPAELMFLNCRSNYEYNMQFTNSNYTNQGFKTTPTAYKTFLRSL